MPPREASFPIVRYLRMLGTVRGPSLTVGARALVVGWGVLRGGQAALLEMTSWRRPPVLAE
jgi:hypothetical protein